MVKHSRPFLAVTFALLFAGAAFGGPPPDVAAGKVAAGAAFLKSGDTDLAVKTFANVLAEDPTNWQARSLLLLAYLTLDDVDKAQAELQRLKTLRAPEATTAQLEQHLAGVRQRGHIRDEVAGALRVGKWRQALTTVEASGFDDSRKRLMRAYVATLRGDFDEATTLASSDP